MNLLLPADKSLQLIEKIIQTENKFHYDKEKHRIVMLDELSNEKGFFRLPVHINWSNTKQVPNTEALKYVVMLVQAGAAAVGLFDDTEVLDHKAFKSYMVRKKQGISQIKYLKTKGKSKAGSRVRLGNTIEFFEHINERVQNYFKENEISRIAVSCSKTLWPFIFNSKIECPFQKNDDRIFKIPKHVHEPNFEVLTKTHQYLLKGEFINPADDQELNNMIKEYIH